MLIDALQYISPSRAVFEQLRAGRLSAVHVTVGYHEDFLGVVQNLQVWNRWFEDCSDVIARAVTCEENQYDQNSLKIFVHNCMLVLVLVLGLE